MASLEALLRLLGSRVVVRPPRTPTPRAASSEPSRSPSRARRPRATALTTPPRPRTPPSATSSSRSCASVPRGACHAPPGADRAAPPGRVLRVRSASRLVLRDERFVDVLLAVDGAVVALGAKFETYAALHFAPLLRAAPPRPPRRLRRRRRTLFAFRDEILGELASVFKKLASAATCRGGRSATPARTASRSPLPTRDASLLTSALVILRARNTRRTASERSSRAAGVDHLLLTLREYGAPFRHLAADVVRAACRLEEGRDECRRLGGVAATCDALRAELAGRDAFSSRGRGGFLPATQHATTASGSAEGSEDGRVSFDWSAAEALLRLLGGVLVVATPRRRAPRRGRDRRARRDAPRAPACRGARPAGRPAAACWRARRWRALRPGGRGGDPQAGRGVRPRAPPRDHARAAASLGRAPGPGRRSIRTPPRGRRSRRIWMPPRRTRFARAPRVRGRGGAPA